MPLAQPRHDVLALSGARDGGATAIGRHATGVAQPNPTRRRRGQPVDRGDGHARPGAPPPVPRDPNGRERAKTASALNALAGIWLVISPWVLDYVSADHRWNPVVFGGILTLLALARAYAGVEADWIAGVNMAIGAWLLGSAFWLTDSARATWNVGIVGTIVFLLAAYSLMAGRGPGASPPAVA
jgi:hypothetical protein